MGQYAFNLLRALADASEAEFEFIVYLDSDAAASEVPRRPNFRVRVLRPSPYPIWEQFVLPIAASQDRLAILHCLFNTAPCIVLGAPPPQLIITVHDVMYLMPHTQVPRSNRLYHEFGRRYRAAVVPAVARRAAKVIAVSNQSKSDALEFLPVDSSRVTAIASAPDPAFCRILDSSKIASARHRYNIVGPFIFALGAIDPRKNTEFILEAFCRLCRSGDFRHTLVLSGLTPDAATVWGRWATSRGIRSRVVLLGFVPLDDLVALYNEAELFLYPSLYEGFGFPIIEAMACGTPVICSAEGALRELSGDAVVSVDPRNVDALCDAVNRVTSDAILRRDLVERGAIRAASFSWNRTAAETLAVYRQVTSLD